MSCSTAVPALMYSPSTWPSTHPFLPYTLPTCPGPLSLPSLTLTHLPWPCTNPFLPHPFQLALYTHPFLCLLTVYFPYSDFTFSHLFLAVPLSSILSILPHIFSHHLVPFTSHSFSPSFHLLTPASFLPSTPSLPTTSLPPPPRPPASRQPPSFPLPTSTRPLLDYVHLFLSPPCS